MAVFNAAINLDNAGWRVGEDGEVDRAAVVAALHKMADAVEAWRRADRPGARRQR